MPVRQAEPADERTDIAGTVQLMRGSNDEVLHAIALIDAAASGNDAAALERKALLEAVGCGRPQSWDSTLDADKLKGLRWKEITTARKGSKTAPSSTG